MDWDALADGWVGFWSDSGNFRDVVLPAASILVSALIAVIILATQLAAGRQDRRHQAIANLSASIAVLSAEGQKKNDGSPHEVSSAIESMDAAATALRLVVPANARSVPMFVRDEIMIAYLNDTNWGMLAMCGRMSSILTDWAEGSIPTRHFRWIATWGSGGRTAATDLRQHWQVVLDRQLTSDGSPEGDAWVTAFKGTTTYRRLCRWAEGKPRARGVHPPG